MANPRRPGITGTGADNLVLPDPLDPEELRQIKLLQEAVLNWFTATPNVIQPYSRSTLGWNITMPTTVIPGVHIEVHFNDGVNDALVGPTGGGEVFPHVDTTYALYLKTPLAARQLGTLTLGVNFGFCRIIPVPGVFIHEAVKREANNTLPASGQVSLRGSGATLDIGINSFVVDVPLEASVPNWFNANMDVRLGFSIAPVDGNVRVTNTFAKTTVSFGVLSGLLSAGCTAAVAKALEAQSDGFLAGIVGPVLADRIANVIRADLNDRLRTLNDANPLTPYRFYDLSLIEQGLDYRFCPVTPIDPDATHPDPGRGGGNEPRPN